MIRFAPFAIDSVVESRQSPREVRSFIKINILNMANLLKTMARNLLLVKFKSILDCCRFHLVLMGVGEIGASERPPF